MQTCSRPWMIILYLKVVTNNYNRKMFRSFISTVVNMDLLLFKTMTWLWNSRSSPMLSLNSQGKVQNLLFVVSVSLVLLCHKERFLVHILFGRPMKTRVLLFSMSRDDITRHSQNKYGISKARSSGAVLTRLGPRQAHTGQARTGSS